MHQNKVNDPHPKHPRSFLVAKYVECSRQTEKNEKTEKSNLINSRFFKSTSSHTHTQFSSPLSACYYVCHQVGFITLSIRRLLFFKCKHSSFFFQHHLQKTDGGRTERLIEKLLPTCLFLFKPKILKREWGGRSGSNRAITM